ncbi:hypothetical protein [Polaribacter sp. SA4-12]|uniref:hypothetical protein n=1 Tax=Polaribacter sp. SA4-12 TaxID=1312072 RepID=UPI000B3D2263|nr:hypothetical protein [Polaribacter sp. SA4-12]ARV14293.1 hypothetical protein BTO07_03610 [Polaribacter sp. SA4-12]
MSAIKINNIVYKGWKETIEILNSEIKVLVVPETGRIMHFSFINGENILYENPDLEGVVFSTGEFYKKDHKIKAPNVGGNRVLPCSEDYFHLITGSRHVPDPFINASSYAVTFLSNGVVLESPISKLLGIQIKRTITISEVGTGVKIQQELVKIIPAKNDELEKIPFTIWSLSKIKTPNISYSKIAEKSIFKDGFTISKWPDATNYAEENVIVNDTILKLKSSEEFPQKIGLDAKKWVAGYLKNTLFIEQFKFDDNATYPDNGTSVTIFGNHLFTELECLSPEKTLSIGESIQYDLHWNLCKVNDESEVNSLLENL